MPSRSAGASAHIDRAGQQASSLLHDGHAWNDFPPTMPGTTRRALRKAEAAGASLFVHASFAFVRAVERGAELDEPLRSCAAAILESEALVLAGPLPACVVRLGYLWPEQCQPARGAGPTARRAAAGLGLSRGAVPAAGRRSPVADIESLLKSLF